MASVKVKWRGANVAQDETNRLVTDEQIERWDKGYKTVTSANLAITGGLYNIDIDEASDDSDILSAVITTCGYETKDDGASDDYFLKKYNSVISSFSGYVVLDNIEGEDYIIQQFSDLFGYFDCRRIGKVLKDDIFWGKWIIKSYAIEIDKYFPETTEEKAARILQDFTYEIDSETDNVVLTGWKETLNGEPSAEMVIPDTDEIQIEF